MLTNFQYENINEESTCEMVQICELESCGLGQGPVTGSCEHGNEPLGLIKGHEFFD